jgi:hypothetical protein
MMKVSLTNDDPLSGSLDHPWYVQADGIYALEKELICTTIGLVRPEKMQAIRNLVFDLFFPDYGYYVVPPIPFPDEPCRNNPDNNTSLPSSYHHRHRKRKEQPGEEETVPAAGCDVAPIGGCGCVLVTAQGRQEMAKRREGRAGIWTRSG